MFADRSLFTEYEVHCFNADAAELGIKAGQLWPRTIETNLGNGRPLIAVRLDATQAVYVQAVGCVRVTIYND